MKILSLTLIACSLLAAGCIKTMEPLEGNYEPATVEQYLSTVTDQRQYGLTLYESDSGPALAGGWRTHSGHYAQLKFLSKKDSTAPVVSADGRSDAGFKGLIDTSSPYCWAHLQAAGLMELHPVGPPYRTGEVTHVLDDQEGIYTFGTKFRSKQLAIEYPSFFVRLPGRNLGPLRRGLLAPQIDMIIGCELLSQLSIAQIDFPKREVVLAASARFTPSSLLMASVPVSYTMDGATIDVSVDGQLLKATIDTGGDYDLCMPDQQQVRILSLGQGENKLVFMNPMVQTPEQLGLPEGKVRIGRGLLASYKMTFYKADGMLYFERPSGK